MDSFVRIKEEFFLLKIFFSRIPSDFLWPKLEKSSSSRPPLSTITNQTHRSNTKRSSKEKPIVNSDNNTQHFYPSTDHNNFNIPTIYPDQLQVK